MAICRPALARALHQGLWRSLLEGREEMAALLAEIHKRGAADDALTADIAVLLSRFAAAGIVIDSARRRSALRPAVDRTGAADPEFDCRRLFQ
ncbi:LuxR family MalT-like ATP-dependent transcriptional regulator [Klebsiella michiganensis]|nr:LuxR family MalT-like ATP-dependent transcriptional regulator [Klebsiella michiganensis]